VNRGGLIDILIFSTELNMFVVDICISNFRIYYFKIEFSKSSIMQLLGL
jgi:hypothetical protein